MRKDKQKKKQIKKLYYQVGVDVIGQPMFICHIIEK